MTYSQEQLLKNQTNNEAAIRAGVDHSWLRNSVQCAFARMSLNLTWGKGEPWADVHILHAYGIDRYGYLWPPANLPRHEFH